MSGLPYKLLNQTSNKLKIERIKNLQLLYSGGDEIKCHAERFIPKEEFETSAAYKNKLKWAYYTNYLANVVNNFTGNIFSKPLSINPASDADDSSTPGESLDSEQSTYYRSFSENSDLQGNSFKSILKQVTTTAMVAKFSYLAVNFPSDEDILSNPELEGTPYCYEIPPLHVIDWNQDRFGKFTFLIIKDIIQDRLSITQDRSYHKIQFTVWEKQNNLVTSKVYEIKCKVDECPNENDIVPLVKEFTTDFKEIPILKFEIPEEMWIGNLIADISATIFRQKTCLASSMARNCSPVLVYKQGAEITDKGDISEISLNPNRGNSSIQTAKSKGAVVVGPDDEFSFAEPSGSVFAPMMESIKENVDELYRIVCSMAQSAKSSSHQTSASGLSKEMDNHSQEIMIKTYAEQVKIFSKKVYNLISQAKDQSIVWNVSGMEDYKLIDKDLLFQELQSVSIPSPTFLTHHLTRIATDYETALSESEVTTVKDEISKAVKQSNDLSSFVIKKQPTSESITDESKKDK